MKDYLFDLILDDELDDDQLCKLNKVFNNNIGTARSCGKEILTFDVEGDSFETLVVEYIRKVEGLLPGNRVVRVEPDDLVTILEIADRCETGKQRIHNYVKGIRGDGLFPLPTLQVSDKTYYSWLEVSKWLKNNTDLHTGDDEQAEYIATINSILDARRHIKTKKELINLWDSLKVKS